MAINSAQGIASLYRGNPQPLQQSIQKDQQAKPGLPPDLQKMLALQIVTNEKDSVTAQKAMDQLQKMGGPSGKPPTVMQSLQQQAEQKLQAQAVQAQQKQQGIQSLMQNAPAAGVPEGTPQPEDQPEAQGIDQLPAEFEMAEGGIVAFQNRGEVPDPLDDANLRAQQALERLRTYSLRQRQQDPEGFSAAQQEYERARAEVAAAERQITGGPAGVMGKPMGLPQIRPARQEQPVAAPVAQPKEQPAPPQVEQKVVAPPEKLENRPPAQERPASIADISALAKQMQGSQATAAPAAESDAMRIQKEVMNLDPEAERAKAIAERKAALPPQDLSQHDRLIAELEKRKQSLEPKKGFEGLMEYLGEISRADSRGRGSFAAGAAGAARLSDLNKDRATQQFELSKQAIDVSQKKLDAVRKYAEENYNIGRAKFDEVFKSRFAAAKEVATSEAEANKLAKQETLKYFELAQQATLEREKIRAQASGRPFDVQGEYAKAVLAGDNDRAAKLLNIMNSVGEAKKPGLDMDLRKKFSELPDVKLPFMQYSMLKNKANPTEKDLVALQTAEANLAKLARANGIDPSKLGFEGAVTSGKVPPPPPGFKLN